MPLGITELYYKWRLINVKPEDNTMGWCKKDVTPLLRHWYYVFLVDFHVIGIRETWLKEDNCGLYDIPGYHYKEKHRPSIVGGGVAIYVKDVMSFIPREDLSVFNDLVEMVFIEIYGGDLTGGKNVIVGEVYRPPGQDLNEFNQIMQELLEKVQKENKICYVMGDFNINLLNCEKHKQTTDFVDKLHHLLRKEERNYHAELLIANKSNMKKTWSVMKSIVNKNKSKKHQSKFKLNDGSITTNKLEICEKFNNLFIGISPTLANKIPKQSQSPESFMTAQLFNSLYLSNVSDEEVINIINYLKPSSPGYDEKSADILKLILPSICKPLVYILN